MEYDQMGRLLATIDPTVARWESLYDAAGRKITDKDPLGRVTAWQLDALDRVTKVIRPGNSFTTNSFDAVGNLLSTVDALGNIWSFEYDGLNRQVKAIQPNGASTTTLFDASGQVIAETDALGRTTQYSYDDGGRRTSTIDALGNIWLNIYDAAGRLVATEDPMGAGSSMTYDILDRVVSLADTLGNTTSFEYDAAGRRVAKTDAEGRRSITAYDLRDRVTAEIDPEGRMVSYGYDLAGRRVRLTDGANRIWRWEHDALGRVVAEIDPLGNTNRYAYDSAGNRVSRTNARNQTTTYVFNEMNRLAGVQKPLPDCSMEISSFSYDLEGRELSRTGPSGTVTKTWDSVGNLTSETFLVGRDVLGSPLSKTWHYSYDLAGNRIQAVDPEGKAFKYRFDALNRMAELDPPDRNDEISYSFDAAGRPVREIRSGMKTSNVYDLAGRLLETRHERDHTRTGHGGDKTAALRKYEYSPAGNCLSMLDEEGSLTGYSYDDSDRLTGVSYPDGVRVSYSYNGAGDRMRETIETPTVTGRGRKAVVGTDTRIIEFSYDPAGRMVSRASDTFIYDPDGNLLREVVGSDVLGRPLSFPDETCYFWSSDNRLLRVEKLVGAQHDAPCDRHGRRKCPQCPPFSVSESYTYEPESWRRLTRTVTIPKGRGAGFGHGHGHNCDEIPGHGWGHHKDASDSAVIFSVYDCDDESHEYLVVPSHDSGKKPWKCPKHIFLRIENDGFNSGQNLKE